MNLWEASIQWGNPYTNPPDDQPRKLIQVFYDASTIKPADIQDIAELLEPGSGYALVVNKVFDPKDDRRKWSNERKAKTRQRNLWKRIVKKMNIAAEQMFLFDDPREEAMKAEMLKRPDYYAGGDKHGEEERKRAQKRQIKLQEYRDKERSK